MTPCTFPVGGMGYGYLALLHFNNPLGKRTNVARIISRYFILYHSGPLQTIGYNGLLSDIALITYFFNFEYIFYRNHLIITILNLISFV